jgi:hypothetical protein
MFLVLLEKRLCSVLQKSAEKAAAAKRQDEKSWAKRDQRTGSAYDNCKAQNARSSVAEECIAKTKEICSLKDARKMVQK